MARASSVKDVAALAGVSLGTVSNVLNRPDRVSPGTRGKVEQAMRDLGFVRNESARQLRAGHSRMLAYVLLDARNPFFTDVAEGAERAAEAADLSLFLCHSDNRASREGDYLAHLVEQRVQGILVTPVDPHASVLGDVRRNGTPLVIVDRTRDDDEFCSVAVDDVLGGRLAVEHLLEQGHTRVAFIGGPATIGQVRDRLEGARQAWAESGLPDDQLVVVPTEGLTVVEGRSAGERVMGIGRKRRPTAAFCANDLLALGLLQQLSTAGSTVPGDLAIVGYDDIEYASAAAVPLTSVRQPRQELGRRATELVLDEADNPDHRHEQVVFTPELVARRSTLG
ncbi:transcriptional regulator, LacI family [Nocardioides exalbidus]|uniref:Transcriptional regulator, LacI family n=1 Tax=Nocardioides exalbidus TaxID=402596 RepID=A0A1H4N9K9_9ACTN|nr:LacI family DNA-binding transcriptional regulator [Nocardioides exalbidus]SEB91991.1 transcriptional regulator, LacI family [Nocardioides exalbidus]